MPDRYPGYDVMRKRDTPSWNAQTRRVIDARLALPQEPQFLSAAEWVTLQAIAARIVPPPRREPIPAAVLVDRKLHMNAGDGYRNASLPPLREAWRLGLRALDAEARAAAGKAFHALDGAAQDALLRRAQQDELHDPAWGTMPPKLFFAERLVRDIIDAYYAYPQAWSEIGFGGPASPRGYVRMNFNKRDPWEAAEAKDGDTDRALRENARVG